MLAPHYAEDSQLGDSGYASAQQLFDFFVFVWSKAMLPDDFGSENGR
jgi:hypothetical protein